MSEMRFVNVNKEFKFAGAAKVAVEGFNLEVNPNEFICITGPSGCGKSTLIKMAAGFIPTTYGEITHRGAIVKTPSTERTVVFQEDAVFPWLTVAKNVGYGPKMSGLTEIAISEVVEKYLSYVGLESYAEYYPKQISGGMKKRVDIARAYANNPSVLLMDEPFGSLDVRTRLEMQMSLIGLWEKDRKTILFVTHDIQEALLLADKIVIMSSPPNSVVKIVDVPFLRPREPELLYVSEFVEMRKEIEDLIHSCH